VIRQRVAAAEGARSAGSSKRSERRKTKPSTPVAPAASCSRREATRSSRLSCSHTTPARPGWRRLSSITRRASCRVLTKIMRAGSRPARASAGGYKSRRAVIHSTEPARRANTPAANSAGAAPCSTAGPPANNSCTAPRARPWPGRQTSSSGTPKGRHGDAGPAPGLRCNAASCARRAAMVPVCMRHAFLIPSHTIKERNGNKRVLESGFLLDFGPNRLKTARSGRCNAICTLWPSVR